MRLVARCLIEEEYDGQDAHASHAAFRVCNQLRNSLSVLTGVKGFASLFSRALNRAGEEVPWLNGLVVDGKGCLVLLSPQAEAEISSKDAAKGGLALVVHLLELLATFIGEGLTLRLVQQVWPRAALDSEKLSKVKS